MFPYAPQPEREPTDPEQVEPDEAPDIDVFVADSVLRHRAARFAEMGFNPRQARALALDRRIETHRVEKRLIARGCPVDLAFDIAS